jgi:hypothetical protein
VDERAVRDMALHQHGVIARRQVLELGGSDAAIDRNLSLGRWDRARDGVYVVGAAPATWQRSAMAATLAAGDGSLLALRSSIRLWGLVERSGVVQVLIHADRRVRLPGIEIHRTRLLEPIDGAVVQAIPVTSLARSLIDVSPTQSASTMGAMVDAAIRLHGLSIDHLAAQVDRLTRPGRAAPRPLIEALLLRAPGYDPGRSALESRVLEVIELAGLPAPVRQHRVVRPDGRHAFIDLSYPLHLLAIEADGWAHHGQRRDFDRDRIRRNDLVLLGWRVLNITSAMTDERIATTIAAALRT